MAKKNFKDINPATAFISSAQPEPDTSYTQEAQNTGEAQQTVDTTNTLYTENTENTENTPQTPDTGNTDDTEYTQGIKKPNAPEQKTKRVNLLIKPSVFEDFKKVAHMKRRSFNDLYNMVIAEYIEREADAIRAYNKTFGEE